MRDILGTGWKTKDLDAVAEAADFDIEKIRSAAAALAQARAVENPTGFMISAVREGYKAAPSKSTKKAAKAASRQPELENTHQYNFQQLELKLLNK